MKLSDYDRACKIILGNVATSQTQVYAWAVLYTFAPRTLLLDLPHDELAVGVYSHGHDIPRLGARHHRSIRQRRDTHQMAALLSLHPTRQWQAACALDVPPARVAPAQHVARQRIIHRREEAHLAVGRRAEGVRACRQISGQSCSQPLSETHRDGRAILLSGPRSTTFGHQA